MKIVIICMVILNITQIQPQDSMKEVRKNNMRVSWKLEKEYIQFEMEAPTNGWVAIGFNETTSLAGTYLLTYGAYSKRKDRSCRTLHRKARQLQTYH